MLDVERLLAQLAALEHRLGLLEDRAGPLVPCVPLRSSDHADGRAIAWNGMSRGSAS